MGLGIGFDLPGRVVSTAGPWDFSPDGGTIMVRVVNSGGAPVDTPIAFDATDVVDISAVARDELLALLLAVAIAGTWYAASGNRIGFRTASPGRDSYVRVTSEPPPHIFGSLFHRGTDRIPYAPALYGRRFALLPVATRAEPEPPGLMAAKAPAPAADPDPPAAPPEAAKARKPRKRQP